MSLMFKNNFVRVASVSVVLLFQVSLFGCNKETRRHAQIASDLASECARRTAVQDSIAEALLENAKSKWNKAIETMMDNPKIPSPEEVTNWLNEAGEVSRDMVLSRATIARNRKMSAREAIFAKNAVLASDPLRAEIASREACNAHLLAKENVEILEMLSKRHDNLATSIIAIHMIR